MIRDVVLLPESLGLNLISRFQNDDFNCWQVVIERKIDWLEWIGVIVLRRPQCGVVIESVLARPNSFQRFEFVSCSVEIRNHMFFFFYLACNLDSLLTSFYFSFNIRLGSDICKILKIWQFWKAYSSLYTTTRLCNPKLVLWLLNRNTVALRNYNIHEGSHNPVFVWIDRHHRPTSWNDDKLSSFSFLSVWQRRQLNNRAVLFWLHDELVQLTFVVWATEFFPLNKLVP